MEQQTQGNGPTASAITGELTALRDAQPTKAEPVVFDSPHYYALARIGLQLYAEELKALAKKNQGEGRAREARSILEDAAAIEERIVPQLAAQRELPLVPSDQLDKAIRGAVQVFVFRAFDGAGDPKTGISKKDFERRRDRLVKELTERLAAFAHDVAEYAWFQGFQARHQTPESLAFTRVQALRDPRAD